MFRGRGNLRGHFLSFHEPLHPGHPSGRGERRGGVLLPRACGWEGHLARGLRCFFPPTLYNCERAKPKTESTPPRQLCLGAELLRLLKKFCPILSLSPKPSVHPYSQFFKLLLPFEWPPLAGRVSVTTCLPLCGGQSYWKGI